MTSNTKHPESQTIEYRIRVLREEMEHYGKATEVTPAVLRRIERAAEKAQRAWEAYVKAVGDVLDLSSI